MVVEFVTERPTIYPIQVLKRLDKPILRYFNKLNLSKNQQNEINVVKKLRTPLQEMEELDKLLYLDQEFTINMNLLKPMPMHNDENKNYFKPNFPQDDEFSTKKPSDI